MNKTALLATLALSLSACEGTPSPDSPPQSDPVGYSDFIAFHAGSTDAEDNSITTLDRCSIGGEHATIALVTVRDAGTRVEIDCPNPTWPSHTRYEVQLIEAIVGAPPSTFPITAGLLDVELGRPAVGDSFLLSMRERDGVYVPFHVVSITFEASSAAAIENSTADRVDLPNDRPTLAQEIQSAQSDPSCDNSARNRQLINTDTEFSENLAPDRLCDDANALPAGSCRDDSDCGELMRCESGACRAKCDPSTSTNGCLVTDP